MSITPTPDPFLNHEVRIVWLTPPAQLGRYVRESTWFTMRNAGKPSAPAIAKVVGYAVHARKRSPAGRRMHPRRVFWISRKSDVYPCGVPSEAVDPLSIAPGVRGRRLTRTGNAGT